MKKKMTAKQVQEQAQKQEQEQVFANQLFNQPKEKHWAERELDSLYKSFDDFKYRMPSPLREFYSSGSVSSVISCNEQEKLEVRQHLQALLKMFS